MLLRKWHGTTVKPHINHFRNTIHRATTFFTFQMNTVNIWFMQFYITNIPDGFFLKIRFRLRRILVITVFTNPDWERRAPETISSDVPIDEIFKEFTETAIFNVIWVPFYFLVVFQKLILHFCRFDEPAFNCIIKKR